MKTRECILMSCNGRMAFMEKCYTLGCENCDENGKVGWTVVGAKKLKFYEWSDRENARENTVEYFTYNDAEFRKNNFILPVYDGPPVR